MSCADFRRAEYTCRNAETHFFQLWSNDAESLIRVVGHVLEETPVRPGLADDPRDLRPEPSGIVGSAHSPRDGFPLAWVPSNDPRNEATILAAVEGS